MVPHWLIVTTLVLLNVVGISVVISLAAYEFRAWKEGDDARDGD